MSTKSHLKKLGLKVRDRVTGFSGVLTSVSFELYGCVQGIVTPAYKEGQSEQDSRSKWFDVTRLEVLSESPVMETPNFKKGYISEGKKGAASKPLPPHA